MDTKAFTFHSSANYRAGGSFKEKPALSLTDQQIMVDDKGSHFQAIFPDASPTTRTLRSQGTSGWRIRLGTPFDWWQCQLNFAIWCATAGCGVSYDWQQKLDHGWQGLGSYSTYIEPSGAYRHSHQAQGPFFHPMDAIRHNRDISRAWTRSSSTTRTASQKRAWSASTTAYGRMFGPSWGRKPRRARTFSRPGRDSTLKSNSWPTSKTPLPRPSTSLRASPDIKETLQYASSPLDYVFGIGLYLAPSDMELHMGNIQGYNNEIVIAGSDAVIGHNPGINESEPISGTKGDKAFQGKIAPPAGTVHRGSQAAETLLDGTSAARVYTASTEQSGFQPRAAAAKRAGQCP